MKWKQRLQYQMDQYLAKGTLSLVWMLLVVTFTSVVVIGLLAWASFGREDSVFGTIWMSFMQTLDAGNLSDAEGPLGYVFLMTVSTVIGIFLTSILISILSNGLQTRLENLRKGTSRIMEKNHSLILGWNDNVPVIVKELVLANRSVRRPVIALLVEEDAPAVLEQLRAAVGDFGNSKVIVRTGIPWNVANLERCAVGDARSVILSGIDDPGNLKTILALRQTAFFGPEAIGTIAAVFAEEKNLRLAKDVAKDRLEGIHLAASMNRIMAQTCLQPGLSFVYKTLLDFEGVEFYFFRDPRLNGMVFSDALHLFRTSVLCGFLRGGKAFLNPPRDSVLGPEDQAIVIAEDDDAIFLDGIPREPNDPRISALPHRDSRTERHILAIGRNENTLMVLREMVPFVTKGSRVTLLCGEPVLPAQLEDAGLEDGLLRLEIRIGSTCDRDCLEAVDYAGYDTIIVFANHPEDGEKSDSETLLTVLGLKQILAERNLSIPIIIEIEKNRNEEILQYASVDDFIISNVLSTKMLCQVAENRGLNAVFADLLDVQGSEIYLKRAEDYVPLGEPADFHLVTAAASRKNEIAIGYRTARTGADGGVVLDPDKSVPLVFSPGDRIIVMAED